MKIFQRMFNWATFELWILNFWIFEGYPMLSRTRNSMFGLWSLCMCHNSNSVFRLWMDFFGHIQCGRTQESALGLVIFWDSRLSSCWAHMKRMHLTRTLYHLWVKLQVFAFITRTLHWWSSSLTVAILMIFRIILGSLSIFRPLEVYAPK